MVSRPADPRLAVVGLGCRAHRSSSANELWESLASPAELPLLDDDRWSAAVHGGELPPGLEGRFRGATIDDYSIDWREFRLPPIATERMHRMERAALGAMNAALQDAGVSPDQGPRENARVYVAASSLGPDPLTDHARRIRRVELHSPISQALNEVVPELADDVDEVVSQLFNLAAPPVEADSMQTSASMIAARVANLYDLRGGHWCIDAGASSSTTALEQAARALALGDTDLVVVCAISPFLEPSLLLSYAHRGALGDGSPEPFRASTRGTTLGEAAVAIVLQREADVAERGRCRAFIEGIATSLGPRAGTGAAMAEPVERAARLAIGRAGVDPADVSVIASRAAGVVDTDAAERKGLGAAYWGRARGTPLWLSSHVDRLGFVQSAGGLLSVAQAVLGLQRGRWRGDRVDASDLGLPDGDLELEEETRVAVSDAGLSAVAGHVVLAGPRSTTTPRGKPRARAPDDAVAIVGVGAIAPRAPDARTLWANILAGVDGIGDLPPSRWDPDELIDASPEVGQILKTRLAGTVEIPEVDPHHFRLPQDLEQVDPAVILALVASEEALTSARLLGIVDPDRVQVILGQLPVRAHEADADKRALFAAHLELSAQAMREIGVDDERVDDVTRRARLRFNARNRSLDEESLFSRTSLTVASSVASAFGFRGGAFAVDAACASALAAVDFACDSLLVGEADAVVAGGVAFNLIPEYYMMLSMLGALSPTGAPPFELGAEGFVPAEGAGVVVLRRLSEARRNGERVLGVIRGIGRSSDGRGRSVYAPSPAGQRRAIGRALDAAGVSPAQVDLIEAHGGGTALGDSAEIDAYQAEYGVVSRGRPAVLGTVKSQIGHMSAAAGAVGLIKAASALVDRMLPPARSVDEPKADLSLEGLELAAEPRPWTTRPGARRYAAVSAFGLGGINYHVLLEEPPEPDALEPEPDRIPVALPTRGARADRFVVDLAPVALPTGARPRELTGADVVMVGAACAPMERALARAGARVEVLTPAEVSSTRAARADGFIDLRAWRAERGDDDGGLDLALETLALLQRAQPALERGAFYLAVTGRGGELGLLGALDGDPAGAQLAGWLKAIKQEIPASRPKVMDFAPTASLEEVASVVLDELEDGSERVEVGFMGRRLVERFRRASFAPGAPALRPVSTEDVWLFSGGGRGVTFECAAALAALGARVVVTGRTTPSEGAPWLELDDDAFAEFKRASLAEARAEEPRLTPVQFEARFAARERQRELHQNLARARALDLPLEYRVCDVTDAEAVAGLVDDLLGESGRLDGVVHGAMVERSRGLARKTEDDLRSTWAAKVDGARNLLAATRELPLRSFIAFGSGAGRFGNRGQADYAAANAQMAALITREARHRPECHLCTLDWTAWEEVGAAAANPDIARLVKATGVTAIKPSEGTYWFLAELTAGDASEVVIFEEQMLHTWPGIGSRAEGGGEGEGHIVFDDLGAPLVPGEFPMVDRVIEAGVDLLSYTRTLDIERDVFLAQHRLFGVPIVPATFGVELLAEGAVLAAPGWEIAEIEDVLVDEPCKLHREEPLTVRVTARVRRRSRDRLELVVESSSHLFLRGRVLKRDRLHHRATVHMRPRGTAPGGRVEIPSLGGVPRARSYFHLAKEPVGLGPIFSRAEWIRVGDRVVTGEVRPMRQRDCIRSTARPKFQVDPLLLDAAFQIAANWDGYVNGFVSVPLGVGRLEFGRPRAINEGARVVARAVRVDDPEVLYDLEVAGEDDAPLLRARGLRLRRVGALEGV